MTQSLTARTEFLKRATHANAGHLNEALKIIVELEQRLAVANDRLQVLDAYLHITAEGSNEELYAQQALAAVDLEKPFP